MTAPARPGNVSPLSGRLDWQDDAACKGEDPELFFAPDAEDRAGRLTREARARAICASCPVARDCRLFARSMGHQDGIWGGRDFGQRLCRNKLHLMAGPNILDRGDGTVNCRECRRLTDQRYRVRREEKVA